MAVYGGVERELTAELIRRLPPGPDAALHARVLAATFLGTLRVATQHWIDHPDKSLADLVRTALTFVSADA